MTTPMWPLFDLVVRTPRLELRLPREHELMDLVGRIDSSIYGAIGFMPFHQDWTAGGPPSMQFHWKVRADWKPDDWSLALSPFVDGQALGTQGMLAKNFGVVRSVETGSWLLAEAQGQGLGTEMRAAALHLAFEGLGALEATAKRMLTTRLPTVSHDDSATKSRTCRAPSSATSAPRPRT